MNKYIVLALLPVLFQSSLHCEDQFKDLDNMLKPQLIIARNAMKSSIALELEPILNALVLFGKKSSDLSVIAINKINDIKIALNAYKSEQYVTVWDNICYYFGSHPEKVVKEINPALAKVDSALKSLQANASNLGWKIALGLAAAAIAGTIIWASTDTQKPAEKEMPVYLTREDVADYWANRAAALFGMPGSVEYNAAYKAAYEAADFEAQYDDVFNNSVYNYDASQKVENAALSAAFAAIDKLKVAA